MRLALLFLLPLALLGQNPFTLSEKDELELGRAASAAVDKDTPLLEDPEVVKYVEQLGQSLVKKSGRSGIAYTFKVVDTPDVNAFALPGGYIYVNRGLIETAASEDELAGVLAHEIGHVVARHGADQAARTGLLQTGLGALGSLLGRGPASTIGETAAQMVSNGVFMKFSRQAERDADRLGARMMFDANFQPEGMVSFFEKLAAIQKSQPNVVQRFFSSHPSTTEREGNVSTLIAGFPPATSLVEDEPAFHAARDRLQSLPRPEVEAARKAAALAASAKPPSVPSPEALARNRARDREIASRFAPIFHEGLGPNPAFDLITNFDFDGDWIGDNNWKNGEDPRFPLKAYVYSAVFETRTHFLIHYACYHTHDYKGGEERGALLSQALRIGAGLGGQYDPTGRANELVAAHENDLEGALVVAEKHGDDPAQARLILVETLAHNAYLKFTPPGSPVSGDPLQIDGTHPHLFIEAKGHGIEAWRGDRAHAAQAEKGILVYRFTGTAEDPDQSDGQSIGYDLLSTYDTFWPHAQSGKNETYGEDHDYGFQVIRFARGGEDVDVPVKLGSLGSALNGKVGAANMSRPPWGWFDGTEQGRPLGEWFLQPAEVIRRHWKLPESFSTTYVYNPFFGQFR